MKSRRLLIIAADIRKGNIETALNRIAKSSAASVNICESISRTFCSIPSADRQDHAHPDIDSLTASVFARWHHRARRTWSRIYEEIRILAGTITRERYGTIRERRRLGLPRVYGVQEAIAEFLGKEHPSLKIKYRNKLHSACKIVIKINSSKFSQMSLQRNLKINVLN